MKWIFMSSAIAMHFILHYVVFRNFPFIRRASTTTKVISSFVKLKKVVDMILSSQNIRNLMQIFVLVNKGFYFLLTDYYSMYI